jgi:formate hydrogenlyase transcriptional activator
LRERREDIPLLVSYFVQKFGRQMQKRIETIPAATMKALTEWEWPGNIRELANFIERAVILTRGSVLEAPLAELTLTKSHRASSETTPGSVGPREREEIVRIVRETLSEMDRGGPNSGAREAAKEYDERQREEIVRTLAETRGRVGGAEGAAARLGINRTTLLARMKKLAIDRREFSYLTM